MFQICNFPKIVYDAVHQTYIVLADSVVDGPYNVNIFTFSRLFL